MDKTGLFRKKMPQMFIAKEECHAPSFKAAKDRCISILCSNFAGRLIKPSFIYKSARPRALQCRNLNLLPVYWMHKKKAWMMKEPFLRWFQYCCLLEEKDYFKNKGMELKSSSALTKLPNIYPPSG
ncbi:tigger transposable element-derived protein 1-like [Palaemon carinicauda]|uniref:tigger transposable element-derived protein 1-like n=1 Tax=Palaemon carinicauda TaxID=392227 RepID=UPI0035B626FE